MNHQDTPPPLTLEQAHQMALDHFNAGRLPECEGLCHTILETLPQHTPTLNMLGAIAQQVGRYDLSAERFQQAITQDSHNAQSHLGLGLSLLKLDQPGQAEICFNQALDLNPNCFQSLCMLGSLRTQRGEPEAAMTLLEQSLTINPHYLLATERMAQAASLAGDLEKASSLYRACHTQTQNSLHLILTSQAQMQAGEIEAAATTYREALSKVLPQSSSPKAPPSSLDGKLEQVIALQHFGRSGTMLFHSLFDGHPEITTLPGVLFNTLFMPNTEARLDLSWHHSNWRGSLVDRFMDLCGFLFDPCGYRGPMAEPDAAANLGFDCMGEDRTQKLSLNPGPFRNHLMTLLEDYPTIDMPTLFKLIHIAYEKSQERPNPEARRIFYHIHNTQIEAFHRLLARFPDTRLLTALREPVQSLESLLYEKLSRANRPELDSASRQAATRSAYDDAAACFQAMWENMFLPAHAVIPSIGVRLEDLKSSPKTIMPKLAAWAGIAHHASLYQSTFQGLSYWGPSSKLTPKIRGFEGSSVQRKVGALFSKRDALVFRTLFYPFRVHFGYQQADESVFRHDLNEIKPMLQQPLDFETTWLSKQTQGREKPQEQPAYHTFHNSLQAAWNCLNQRHGWRGLPAWLRP
ncbi:MAG: tetratricopeptide repeat protein [Magnetococcales bacterium]|nr:tetratricopeptide repeat protein [Magnetococcales bacterium]